MIRFRFREEPRATSRPVVVAPGGRWRHLLVDGPELAAIAALASAVTLWGVPSRGGVALDVVPFALALAYFCILAGRVVVGALRLPADRFGDIPTVILVGFLALNTLLLAAALALPLSLSLDALLIGVGFVGWAVRGDPPARRSSSSVQGLGCLVLSLVAATLWTVDSIEPIVVGPDAVVFKPWADGFTHACFIRLFVDAHGIGSLDHFSMAGEVAPFYHYASFPIPALLAVTSKTSCYLAFATFLVPFGMSLTGLAAFVLARWWWSPGAGLAAAAGVLLIPDASHYGVANPYLSYHWLAETGPTWVYGIAMIAVAWVLVLEGCRAGRLGLVAAGFVATGLTVGYKAHLFAVSAFLIWVYPAFFLRGYSRRIRLAWLAFSLVTFVLAVRFSWRFPGIPLLKLDGSALKSYVAVFTGNLNRSAMGKFLAIGPTTTWGHDVLAGVAYLTAGTLGAFALAFPVLAVLLIWIGPGADRRARIEAALFPALVTANYLTMALGLALDDRTHHMTDELLHRPLVWAYFAVAAWTLGCFQECVLRPRLARLGPARWAVPVVLLVLLGVPFFFGPGVQVGPDWGKRCTRMHLPLGLVRCAEFLREHSARGQVVQNSERDTWNVLSGLAERPVYVADTWRVAGKQNNEKILRRLDELADFRRLTDPAEIAEFAVRRKIIWYVLDPATEVAWPESTLVRPAFESGGFRVYRFTPAG